MKLNCPYGIICVKLYQFQTIKQNYYWKNYIFQRFGFNLKYQIWWKSGIWKGFYARKQWSLNWNCAPEFARINGCVGDQTNPENLCICSKFLCACSKESKFQSENLKIKMRDVRYLKNKLKWIALQKKNRRKNFEFQRFLQKLYWKNLRKNLKFYLKFLFSSFTVFGSTESFLKNRKIQKMELKLNRIWFHIENNNKKTWNIMLKQIFFCFFT